MEAVKWPVDPAVYLLCFTDPATGQHTTFRHAGHYLGWALDTRQRVGDHRKGNGESTPLIRAAVAAGIRLDLVRWWPGDRHLEATFKNHNRGASPKSRKGRNGAAKGLGWYCPRCNPAAACHRPLPEGWIEPVQLTLLPGLAAT